MSAQSQVRPRMGEASNRRAMQVGTIAALYVACHSVFLFVPPLLDADIPTSAVLVNVAFLVLGAGALTALWLEQKWGWWSVVILSIVDVFLSIGDVVGLEGSMRVLAIATMLMLIATLVLLYRPGVRHARS